MRLFPAVVQISSVLLFLPLISHSQSVDADVGHVNMEGSLLTGPQPGLTTAAWPIGNVSGPTVDNPLSSPTALEGRPYRDWNNPGPIELNKVYRAEFSPEPEARSPLEVKFVVPVGVERVQFQYKSERDVPCEIDVSYTDSRLEYFTAAFDKGQVLYVFTVQDDDLSVVQKPRTADKPLRFYSVKISPVVVATELERFDFAFVTQ